MGQLSDMLHDVIAEAHKLLSEVLFFRPSPTELISVNQLLQVNLAGLEDDCNEESIGYSFLEDDRNM